MITYYLPRRSLVGVGLLEIDVATFDGLSQLATLYDYLDRTSSFVLLIPLPLFVDIEIVDIFILRFVFCFNFIVL